MHSRKPIFQKLENALEVTRNPRKPIAALFRSSQILRRRQHSRIGHHVKQALGFTEQLHQHSSCVFWFGNQTGVGVKPGHGERAAEEGLGVGEAVVVIGILKVWKP
ncbi:hypothetical protein EV1_036144 [Malus domestica]